MELRHLRYFCAVARCLSFTQAARVLHVSQSGVSGQVRELERVLGAELFRRTQREVVLTPAGAALLPEACDILEKAGAAAALVKQIAEGKTGKLSIGLCGPVTARLLPKVIREFRKQFPTAVLSIQERAPAEQIDALLARHIDIGFTRSVPVDVRELLHTDVLFREPLLVVLPKQHPLCAATAESRIACSRLASEPLLTLDRKGTPEVFDAIVAMAKRAKFSPKLVATPNSWQSVLTLVEAGEGLALVPACVRHWITGDLVTRPLSDAACSVEAIVAWRRHDSKALQDRFLAMLRAAEPVPSSH